MARVTAEIQRIELKGRPLKAIGDLNNLNQNLLGIMCSQRCPGDLVLKGFDAARQIRDQGITVVSGFHSSIEKDIFEILLRGNQPVIMCLARNIDDYGIPAIFSPLIESAGLTIIAPDFSENENRITHKTAELRNTLIFEICDQVLLIHAQPGGTLERACYQYFPDQKKIYALSSERNEHLFKQGLLLWKPKGDI